MEDTFDHLTSYYPHAFQQMRGMPLYCPIVNYTHSYMSSGSGGGFGTHGFCSAYGEFVERNHFYASVPTSIQEKISTLNSEQLAASLYHMINQLKETEHNPADHLFRLTKVKNVFDHTDAYLPTVLLTLAYFNNDDRKFIPFMDSCGAAGHVSFEKARDSSLLEFIERQALVASWMKRQYRYKIEPEVLLKIPRYSHLAKQLLTHGEMHVFDIALGLPGYAIMILYFSHSSEDYVQYAIGISAGYSPLEALTKALNELWLDYSFLYTSLAIRNKLEEIQDGKKYTLRHLEDNDAEKTRKLIAYDLTSVSNLQSEDYFSLPNTNASQAFLELQTISDQVFLYHQTNREGNHHFTKILSPDFFLHMSVPDILNIDNLYFKKLGYDPHHLYRNVIPFP